ncbi:MAG: adenylate/guanylate cyclase domain-containing protein, partial [bacterium]
GGLPLPEKPSIVVLPFANLGGDGKEDYFADGITHEIITRLARVPGLFVIARTSSFAYKSRRVRVDQVGRELGVRYVLEGSFQKAGDRIRVAAQLVEASTGRNLWSNTYERRMKDIFDLQDDITRNIVTALEVKLTEGEQARVWHTATSDPKAWDYFVQGVALLRGLKPEETRQAKAAFKKAIDLDPNSAGAITGLGLAHFVEAKYGWSKSVTGSLQRAADLARRAIRIDETLGEPYSLLGSIHLVKRQYAQAILLGKKGVALIPNGAEATALLAMILNYSGRPREALKMAKRAMLLSPSYPHWYLYHLGLANYLMGKYQPATEAFAGVLDRDANSPITHMMLVASYAAARRWKEARAEAAVFRERDYGLTPAKFLPRAEPHKEPAILKKVLADLAKAGLR